MTTKIVLGKITFLFIFITVLGGCGGPKRGSIEGTKGETTNTDVTPTSGTTTSGATTSGGATGGPSGATTSGATGSKATGSPSGAGPAPSATPAVKFSQVTDIFQRECFACHGNAAVANVLGAPVVDWANNYQATKTYVDNGKLFERIWTLKDDPEKGMPQRGGNMTDEERELIKKWIEGGGQE